MRNESPETIVNRVSNYWDVIVEVAGLRPQQIAQQSLVAPARCMLKNAGRVGAVGEKEGELSSAAQAETEEMLVEAAFERTRLVSRDLQQRYL